MIRIFFCLSLLIPSIVFSQHLNLSNQQLTALPDSIFDGRCIVNLDLSGNQLTDLPMKLKDIPGLIHLSLEGNPMEKMPAVLSKMTTLEGLNISNTGFFKQGETYIQLSVLKNLKEFVIHNERVLPDNLFLLKKLKVLKIKNSSLLSSFAMGKYNKLERLLIEGNEFTTLDQLLSHFRQIKTIELLNKGEFKNLELSNLRGLKTIIMKGILLNMDTIAFYNQSLQSLAIYDVPLSKVPKGIGAMKNLKNLYLVNTQLTSIIIPSALKLKFLNVKGNMIDNTTVNRLKRRVQDGNVLYDAQKKFINPQIEEYLIQLQKFIVKADSSSILEVNTEMSFAIPKNAFLYPDGRPVEGTVEIQYREFKDPLDFVASGIPMSYYQEGEHIYMESLQMFEFQPYKNGVALSPNPATPVVAQLKTTNIDPGYQLYSLNTQQEIWVNIGRDDVRRVNQNLQPSFSAPVFKKYEEEYHSPQEPAYNYQVKLEMVYVNYTLRKNYWAVYFSYAIDRENILEDRFKSMDELQAVNRIDWKLKNEEEYKALKQKLIDVQELDFQKNGEEVLITVITSAGRIQFSAVPVLNDEFNPEVQYKNVDQLLNEINALEKVKAYKWKKIDAIEQQMLTEYKVAKIQYDSALAKYNREEELNKKLHKEAFDQQMKEYSDKLKEWNEKSKLYQQFVRFFAMPNFGISNWDKVSPVYVVPNLIASMKGIPFKMKTEEVYLCNKVNNSMITYKAEDISMENADNKALIIVFENGSYGYVSTHKLKKYIKGKPLKAKYFNPEKMSLSQLKQKVFN